MASEPAEPTTRQAAAVQCWQCQGTNTTYQKFSGGKEYYCRDCDDMFPYAREVQGERVEIESNPHGERVGPGLLADPAQTTELAAVVDVPVGSKAYRLINELTADLEQARAQRNEAMETAGQLREEVREHQVAAAKLYGSVFVALGLSITAPWAGLADAAGRVRAERDALSLLLRGMARKLVAYRKWMSGDDVPVVHRLRREAEERQARIDAALALTEPHPLRHWDTQWPIRAALEGMTAAEYAGNDEQQDERTASFGPTAQGIPGDLESTVDADEDPGPDDPHAPYWPVRNDARLSGVALRDVEEADDAAGDQT